MTKNLPPHIVALMARLEGKMMTTAVQSKDGRIVPTATITDRTPKGYGVVE